MFTKRDNACEVLAFLQFELLITLKKQYPSATMCRHYVIQLLERLKKYILQNFLDRKYDMTEKQAARQTEING